MMNQQDVIDVKNCLPNKRETIVYSGDGRIEFSGGIQIFDKSYIDNYKDYILFNIIVILTNQNTTVSITFSLYNEKGKEYKYYDPTLCLTSPEEIKEFIDNCEFYKNEKKYL